MVWTLAGPAARLRFRSWPLTAIPEATEKVTAHVEPRVPSPLAIGRVMPDYTARLLEGKDVSISALRGQVVLLNFWATWCEPCRMELPTLGNLHRRFANRGLQVLGVSLDAQATVSQVKDFAARRKVAYPILLDSLDLASRQLGISTLPVTVVLGRDGTIVWSQTGAVSDDDLSLAAALEAALQ